MRWLLRLYPCAVSLMVLTILTFTPTTLVKADDERGESVVGTWIGTLTLNTPPGFPPFIDLVSFHRGGTLTGTNGIAHFSQITFGVPALQALQVDFSDFFGSWVVSDSSNQVSATFKRLLFAGPNTPTAIYGTFFPGQNVGLVSIQAVGTLERATSGDRITASFTYELTNLNNQEVFAGDGTVSFGRVTIEPLATP